MELRVTVLNLRHGIMQDEGKEPLYWAKVGILNNELESREGFIGVSPAELRIDTSDQNALSKRLEADVKAGKIKLPGVLSLICETAIKKGEVQLKVLDYKLVG